MITPIAFSTCWPVGASNLDGHSSPSEIYPSPMARQGHHLSSLCLWSPYSCTPNVSGPTTMGIGATGEVGEASEHQANRGWEPLKFQSWTIILIPNLSWVIFVSPLFPHIFAWGKQKHEDIMISSCFCCKLSLHLWDTRPTILGDTNQKKGLVAASLDTGDHWMGPSNAVPQLKLRSDVMEVEHPHEAEVLVLVLLGALLGHLSLSLQADGMWNDRASRLWSTSAMKIKLSSSFILLSYYAG